MSMHSHGIPQVKVRSIPVPTCSSSTDRAKRRNTQARIRMQNVRRSCYVGVIALQSALGLRSLETLLSKPTGSVRSIWLCLRFLFIGNRFASRRARRCSFPVGPFGTRQCGNSTGPSECQRRCIHPPLALGSSHGLSRDFRTPSKCCQTPSPRFARRQPACGRLEPPEPQFA